MKINLFEFEKSENQKADLKDKVNLPPEVKLDLAFDVVHGLNDLTRSLADLHPHKRSIALLGSQPPPLRELIRGFAGQGYVIQELPVSFKNFDEPALRLAWDALKKDTLFVLSSAVEPLTGAIYPFDWVRNEAPKKNIFTLIYMSPDALKRGLIVPANPFEGVVADSLWGDEHTLTVVLKGERCQGERLFWGEPHFSNESLRFLEEKLIAVKQSRDLGVGENLEAVKLVEKTISSQISGVHLLGSSIRRLYDRAVFFIEGVNGEALMRRLRIDGFATHTGSACAWNSPHLNSWLPKLGFNLELVESSLIVSAEVFNKNYFQEKLVAHVSDLRQISGYQVGVK